MIDPVWELFARTGNIEAYLLYKEVRGLEDESDGKGRCPEGDVLRRRG